MLTDCIFAAYAQQDDLQLTTNHCAPLSSLTDSEILFKTIMISTVTTEIRFSIDIKTAREEFPQYEIFKIGWIWSHSNIADEMTKLTKCDVLESLLHHRTIDITGEQCIIR